MNKGLKIVIIILIAVIFVTAGAYLWYQKQLDIKASDANTLVEVEIEKGETAKEISVKLQKAGVIKSSDVFFLYVKLNSIGPEIQAGKFQIPQNLTVKEVAALIQKAAGNDLWVTIPEGLRVDEIAGLFDTTFLQEENTQYDKEEFLDILQNPDPYDLEVELLSFKPEGKSLEGFIFPNTYNISKDITSLELAKFLVSSLEEQLAEENIAIETHNELSAYEVLTLASIVEREARESEERYMIADILLKRLRGELDGVKLLQADATLLYEEKDWEAVVTVTLKEKDSEYNTYKKTGLPPTPICNPGIDSIKAVMSPQANDYFYYLHDPEGNIHYAKTNDEHVNNQRCFINKNPDYCL